jgi:hypothetical protein
MTEGAEACRLVDLKLLPIRVFKGAAKVLGEIIDSLGMAEVDQAEVIPNFQLLSPTISRITQMPCHQIMRCSPQEILSYFYSFKTPPPKIMAAIYSYFHILYTSKRTDPVAKLLAMELARTITAAWDDYRVSIGKVLIDR